MRKYKVLNLYACLGGNRLKWDEVAQLGGVELEVTAVELDPELAKLYQERFPDDEVVIADAHQYLLDHYQEFDFIWSSPPCPTHSRARYWGVGANGKDPVYPDMKLYQEVIFLQNHFKGKWCIENVIPYYTPLIAPTQKIGRHCVWANFVIPGNTPFRTFKVGQCKNEVKGLCDFHEFDFTQYNGDQRLDKIARNLVDYVTGESIFSNALGIMIKKDVKQINMFE